MAGIFTAAFDSEIEWLLVKGIADFADGAHMTTESWCSCASVMAASLVKHILGNPAVFRSWPHFDGNVSVIIMVFEILTLFCLVLQHAFVNRSNYFTDKITPSS